MHADPIVDTHMHLWDLANGYEWLSKASPDFERLIGPYESLRRNFLGPDYSAIVRSSNVVQSVYVQALGFPGRPVAEVEWVAEQAGRDGWPHAIVGFADLSDPDVADVLDREAAQPMVRGVRMPLNYDDAPWRRMAARGDYMRDPQWRRGFALLAGRGLLFDMQLYDHQAPDAVALARDFPATTIVVEHLAWPLDLSPEGRDRWARHIDLLAEMPNMVLKVSGIGCILQHCTPEVVRAMIARGVASFGPHRSMFGSNFPPDSLNYTYDALVETYRDALRDRSPAERRMIFCDTARRVYRPRPVGG